MIKVNVQNIISYNHIYICKGKVKKLIIDVRSIL